MDVLVGLVSGDGRTVGKQELLETVWDDWFVTESAIARSVGEIRQAFGDDDRRPRIIETIRKRGYRIVAPIARNAPALTVDRVSPVTSPQQPRRRSASTFWPLTVALLAAVAVSLLLLR